MSKYPNLAKLGILHYPHPGLRERARRIEEIDSFLAELSERMTELMREGKGVGLAATQVGWPFRFILIKPTPEPGHAEAFINPVIIARKGKVVEEEGCLSLPGVFAKVKRAEKVRVRATRPDGEEVEMESEGVVARGWQHEIDHLDGGLFVDRLGPTARIVIAGQLRELERKYREVSADKESDGNT